MKVRHDRNDSTSIFRSHSINKYHYIKEQLDNGNYIGNTLEFDGDIVTLISCEHIKELTDKKSYKFIGTFNRTFYLYIFNVLINGNVPEYECYAYMLLDSFCDYPKPYFRIYTRICKRGKLSIPHMMSYTGTKMYMEPNIRFNYNEFLFKDGHYTKKCQKI